MRRICNAIQVPSDWRFPVETLFEVGVLMLHGKKSQTASDTLSPWIHKTLAQGCVTCADYVRW